LNNDFVEYKDLKNSQFIYLQKLSTPSNALYNFILITIITTLVALPFISIDLTSSSPVSIQSGYLKETVYIPQSGKISLLKIVNNKPIKKGDTIVAIDNIYLSNEISITKKKEEIIEQNLHDIALLQKSKLNEEISLLFTTQYETQFSNLLEEKASLLTKLENAKKTYERNLILFKEKVIAPSEFEQYDLAYKQAQANIKLLEIQSRSRWQTEQYQLNQELNQYN